MATIGQLVVELKATVDKFNADMKSAQREVSAFEKNYKPTLDLLRQGATIAAAAGTAIVAALATATKVAANYQDSIRDASIRTGIATESMSALKLAAEQSGASFEDLTTGLRFLERNMSQVAAIGKGPAAEAFNKLGISVGEVKRVGSDTEAMLRLVSSRFAELGPEADHATIATELFGRGGAKLVEFLSLGSDGLDRFNRLAELFGIKVGQEAADAADKFNDSLNNLKQASLGLTVTLGNQFIPKLADAINIATAAAAAINSWWNETDKSEKATVRATLGGMAFANVMKNVKETLTGLVTKTSENFFEIEALNKAATKAADVQSGLRGTVLSLADANRIAAEEEKKRTKLIDDLVDAAKAQMSIEEQRAQALKTINDATLKDILDHYKRQEELPAVVAKARAESARIASETEQVFRDKEREQMDADEAYAMLLQKHRLDNIKATLEKIKDVEEKAAKERKEAFEDVSRAAGAVFDDLFVKGESVFASLGNMLKGGALSLGRAIFQDIAGHLLGPTKQAIDQFLSGLISPISRSLGNKVAGLLGVETGGNGSTLDGILSKGGILNLIGGKSGGGVQLDGMGLPGFESVGAGGAPATGIKGALGLGGGKGLFGLGSATIPVLGAAAMGIVTLATNLIGRGRRTADEFVQNFQNPFGDMIGQITDVGEFDMATASFWKSANQFASQGDTEAKVVRQAHSTLDAFLAQRRADLVRDQANGITVVQNITTQPGMDNGQLANMFIQMLTTDGAFRRQLQDAGLVFA